MLVKRHIFNSFQLYSKYLEISGCTIQTIESEAIAGSGIVDVILNGNTYVHFDLIKNTPTHIRIVHENYIVDCIYKFTELKLYKRMLSTQQPLQRT